MKKRVNLRQTGSAWGRPREKKSPTCLRRSGEGGLTCGEEKVLTRRPLRDKREQEWRLLIEGKGMGQYGGKGRNDASKERGCEDT